MKKGAASKGKSKKGAARKPAKAAPKKAAAAKRAAAKKPAAKKAASKAASKAAAKKPAKPVAKASKSAKGKRVSTVPSEHGTPLAAHAGRAMIIQSLGDAEAYFFDFDRLGQDKRAELIAHHLAAWDARKKSEGQAAWAETFVPVALLGESMPDSVREHFDLSAPHAGVVLFHRPTGSLLHAAGKHDAKLALMAPDIESISPKPSFLGDHFEPADQSYAVTITNDEADGFTRANIEMLMQTGGAELILV